MNQLQCKLLSGIFTKTGASADGNQDIKDIPLAIGTNKLPVSLLSTFNDTSSPSCEMTTVSNFLYILGFVLENIICSTTNNRLDLLWTCQTPSIYVMLKLYAVLNAVQLVHLHPLLLGLNRLLFYKTFQRQPNNYLVCFFLFFFLSIYFVHICYK